MKMHGLGDVAYWAVTYLWFMLLYIVYIAIFIIFGALANLKVCYCVNLILTNMFWLCRCGSGVNHTSQGLHAWLLKEDKGSGVLLAQCDTGQLLCISSRPAAASSAGPMHTSPLPFLIPIHGCFWLTNQVRHHFLWMFATVLCAAIPLHQPRHSDHLLLPLWQLHDRPRVPGIFLLQLHAHCCGGRLPLCLCHWPDWGATAEGGHMFIQTCVP